MDSCNDVFIVKAKIRIKRLRLNLYDESQLFFSFSNFNYRQSRTRKRIRRHTTHTHTHTGFRFLAFNCTYYLRKMAGLNRFLSLNLARSLDEIVLPLRLVKRPFNWLPDR